MSSKNDTPPAGEGTAGSGWRKIETAPKDGTPVLIYRPTAKLIENLIRVDWFNREVAAWWHCSADRQPSHWQPLPSPPNKQAADDAAHPEVPSPTGTELALVEAKRHIALLTRLSTDDPLWPEAAKAARSFIANAPTEGDILADLLAQITDGRNIYYAALRRIAESRDAGRHDGLREECPLHDQYTMWLDAREAIAMANVEEK